MAGKGSAPVATDRPSADVAELWSHVRDGRREGHFYAALFGLRKYDPVYLIAQIQRGLAFSAFERFQRNTELPFHVLAQLVEIPERTLARRREAGRLEPDESDRLVRACRVFARALELFEGDASGARGWLTTPVLALGGRSPFDFARTDVGAIEVDNLIGRLEHGIPV
jgi:putative toxin-antitoxin system antitoxin component (TIGR02293 family)